MAVLRAEFLLASLLGAVLRAEFLLASLLGAVLCAEFLLASPLELSCVQNSFLQVCLELSPMGDFLLTALYAILFEKASAEGKSFLLWPIFINPPHMTLAITLLLMILILLGVIFPIFFGGCIMLI